MMNLRASLKPFEIWWVLAIRNCANWQCTKIIPYTCMKKIRSASKTDTLIRRRSRSWREVRRRCTPRPGHWTAVFDHLRTWSVHIWRIIACSYVLLEHITFQIGNTIYYMVGAEDGERCTLGSGQRTALFDLLHNMSMHVRRNISFLCVFFEHITHYTYKNG